MCGSAVKELLSFGRWRRLYAAISSGGVNPRLVCARIWGMRQAEMQRGRGRADVIKYMGTARSRLLREIGAGQHHAEG